MRKIDLTSLVNLKSHRIISDAIDRGLEDGWDRCERRVLDSVMDGIPTAFSKEVKDIIRKAFCQLAAHMIDMQRDAISLELSEIVSWNKEYED